MLKVVAMDAERDGESDNFYDPRDSMSFTSNTDGEDNTGTEHSARFFTPGAEFYDAWEGNPSSFSFSYFWAIVLVCSWISIDVFSICFPLHKLSFLLYFTYTRCLSQKCFAID